MKIGKNGLIRTKNLIYNDVVIGDNFKTGHYILIRENTIIGDNVLVGTNTVIDGNCTIGNNVSMQTGVYLPTNTTIEDDVFLGPNVTITNDKQMERNNPNKKLIGATIKKGASIGANSTLLPGITIGENSRIGAGSVVTKDVPDNETWFGNPAKRRYPKMSIEDFQILC